jgi:hypothetical protein
VQDQSTRAEKTEQCLLYSECDKNNERLNFPPMTPSTPSLLLDKAYLPQRELLMQYPSPASEDSQVTTSLLLCDLLVLCDILVLCGLLVLCIADFNNLLRGQPSLLYFFVQVLSSF